MKVGDIIELHGIIGIVLEIDGLIDREQVLVCWPCGEVEWFFLPNHRGSSLKILSGQKVSLTF